MKSLFRRRRRPPSRPVDMELRHHLDECTDFLVEQGMTPVEARREAVERMMAQAEQLGANAVVNVRFSTSSVTGGAAELYAYGTAVVVT